MAFKASATRQRDFMADEQWKEIVSSIGYNNIPSIDFILNIFTIFFFVFCDVILRVFNFQLCSILYTFSNRFAEFCQFLRYFK